MLLEEIQLPFHLIGGNFLLVDIDHAQIFTPEDLTHEQRLMAQTAEKFMDKEVLPQAEGMEHHQEGITPQLVRKAGQLGLLGIETPAEYGGLGLGKTSECPVLEQFTRLGGFGVTCMVQCGIGSQAITHFGTEEQKQKYLAKLGTGEFICAYALSEPNSGSDALGMKTRATLSSDGQHYILNGTKMWITNAAWADVFTIFAKVNGEQITAFILDRVSSGVSLGREEHKLGIKSSSTCRVVLEDAIVPRANLLGEIGKGHYIALNLINIGRFKLGTVCIGSAKEALKISVRYAQERQQFGKTLSLFGLIQHKLAEMAIQIFAGESMVYRTAGMIDAVAETGQKVETVAGGFPRSIEEFALECSIIKVACSEILAYVADEAIQIHGGYGYSEEFPLARIYRDARIHRIFEGTNEINRLFIPSHLFRRAQRGHLPLTKAMLHIDQDIEKLHPSDGLSNIDELSKAQQLVSCFKKTILFLLKATHQKLGDSLIKEQEIAAHIADLMIDVYSAESMLLRARKKSSSKMMRDLTLIFLNDSVNRAQHHARQILAAVSEGKELERNLEIIRRLLVWQSLNTIILRQRIAQRLCAVGSYSASLL